MVTYSPNPRVAQALGIIGTTTPKAPINNPGGFQLQQVAKNPAFNTATGAMLATPSGVNPLGTTTNLPQYAANLNTAVDAIGNTALPNIRTANDQQQQFSANIYNGGLAKQLNDATDNWASSQGTMFQRLMAGVVGRQNNNNLMGGGQGGTMASRIAAGEGANLAYRNAADVANQRLANIRYVQDTGSQNLGRYQQLEGNYMQQQQVPLTSRITANEAVLRALGQLGQIDQANNFYGVAAAPTPYVAPTTPTFSYQAPDYSQMINRLNYLTQGQQG